MAALPTVLVPGLYTTPRLFFAQLPALWRFGPVTVADTTRGASLDEIAERLLACAPPRFALCGLSMGGAIALAVMRAAPERVERLALLNTTARVDTDELKGLRRAAIEQLRAGRLDEVADAWFPWLVDPSRADDDELRAIQRGMLSTIGAEAAIGQVEAHMDRPDARPGLGAIAAPTLVLVGAADRLTPPEDAEELAGGIAGARLVVLDQCGHLSALEQPAAVTSWLADWHGWPERR